MGNATTGNTTNGNTKTENATTRMLQSKFFSPTFNTAIFDGPLRLYFNQSQENEALKVYFSLQTHLTDKNNLLISLRERFPKNSTLFIMIYPNKESFLQSFDQNQDLAFEKMGNDYIIGIQGPVSDKAKDDVLLYIQEKFLPQREAQL